MTDALALEFELLKNKISKKDISEKLGISTMSFARKLKNISEFKASEIKILSDILNLTGDDQKRIFFSSVVDK